MGGVRIGLHLYEHAYERMCQHSKMLVLRKHKTFPKLSRAKFWCHVDELGEGKSFRLDETGPYHRHLKRTLD